MQVLSKSLLFAVLALPSMGLAGYTLDPENDYSASTFFDKFDFFTEADPTHGFVEYVDQSTAQSGGLIKSTADSVTIGVDYTNPAPGGRQSVRITSKAAYDNGLFILDLKHMPGSICGTWPAFWTVGPDWPANGEIDIIEGVNDQASNSMTLHTGPGCSIDNSGFSGSVSTSNCDINAPGQGTNAGCSISNSDPNSYGNGFNTAGGGVYAMEMTAGAISVWQFPSGSAPADIASGNPNPSSWPQPNARFAGGCNIPSMIKQQQIVFDITFCGDWAGEVWNSGSCAANTGAATCNDFVANNAGEFKEAYWEIAGLKVFTNGGGSDIPPPPMNSTVRARTAPIVPAIDNGFGSRHAKHARHFARLGMSS